MVGYTSRRTRGWVHIRVVRPHRNGMTFFSDQTENNIFYKNNFFIVLTFIIVFFT